MSEDFESHWKIDHGWRVILYIALFQLTESTFLDISIQTHVHISGAMGVSIACRLDTTNTRTDRVYSLLITRDVDTAAVALSNGRYHIADKRLQARNASVTTEFGAAISSLELHIPLATCSDVGQYSCAASVRLSYRTKNLISEDKRLLVDDRSCTYIDIAIVPHKARYHIGEILTIRCTTTINTKRSHWMWQTNGKTHRENGSSLAAGSDGDTSFNCSSSVSYRVTKGQSEDVYCSLGNVRRGVAILTENEDVQYAALSMDNSVAPRETLPPIKPDFPVFKSHDMDGPPYKALFIGVACSLVLITVVCCVYTCHKRTCFRFLKTSPTSDWHQILVEREVTA